MTGTLTRRDLWDWIVAYRDAASQHNRSPGPTGCWEFQFYALTRMAELAGTFTIGADADFEDIYAEIERMFSYGSFCRELTISNKPFFSSQIGQGLSIATSSYSPGVNFDYFTGEMRRFCSLLPIAETAGIGVAAGMLEAICRRSPPLEVDRLAKKMVTMKLSGGNKRKVEEALVPLIQKCYNAARSVAQDLEDSYWAELQSLFSCYSLENVITRDSSFMPIFGL